ncbi:MAG: methyltransferase domain-containing protein [Opitutales bacterium]|jgi:trans-aconitate methyltransferase
MSTRQVNWNADDYRRNSGAQQKWAAELISRLGDVPPDADIIDIGCGDGRITRELALLAPRGATVGIDASEKMIALARESFREQPNLRFETMDAREMELPERFDIAFSNATLHWFKEQDRFLTRLRAHMKPGGRLCFSFGGKGNAGQIIAVLRDMVKSGKWAGYFPADIADEDKLPYAFLGPDDYVPLLEAAGFAPQSVRLLPRDMSYGSREGLAGWMRTTWMPFTGRIPEQMRGDFIDEVVDEFIRRHPAGEDGTIKVAMFRLEALATAV